MHPNSPHDARRVHTAQFKADVLEQCRKPGVSVAAVALANGLNANLVRKWLVGRGLKRTGLTAPGKITKPVRALPASGSVEPTAMNFVPVRIAAPTPQATAQPDGPVAGLSIQIELCRGDTRLNVQWPASQSEACATWLREATRALLIE